MAALLGIATGLSAARQKPRESSRLLQNCLELLRQRLQALRARAIEREAEIRREARVREAEALAATARREARVSRAGAGTTNGGGMAAGRGGGGAAGLVFDRVDEEGRGWVEASVLLMELLGEGMEPEGLSEIFGRVTKDEDGLISRAAWLEGYYADVRGPGDGSEGGGEGDGGVGRGGKGQGDVDGEVGGGANSGEGSVSGTGASASSGVGDGVQLLRLSSEEPDLLLLYLGSLLYAQCLQLGEQREQVPMAHACCPPPRKPPLYTKG